MVETIVLAKTGADRQAAARAVTPEPAAASPAAVLAGRIKRANNPPALSLKRCEASKTKRHPTGRRLSCMNRLLEELPYLRLICEIDDVTRCLRLWSPPITADGAAVTELCANV